MEKWWCLLTLKCLGGLARTQTTPHARKAAAGGRSAAKSPLRITKKYQRTRTKIALGRLIPIVPVPVVGPTGISAGVVSPAPSCSSQRKWPLALDVHEMAHQLQSLSAQRRTAAGVIQARRQHVGGKCRSRLMSILPPKAPVLVSGAVAVRRAELGWV